MATRATPEVLPPSFLPLWTSRPLYFISLREYFFTFPFFVRSEGRNLEGTFLGFEGPNSPVNAARALSSFPLPLSLIFLRLFSLKSFSSYDGLQLAWSPLTVDEFRSPSLTFPPCPLQAFPFLPFLHFFTRSLCLYILLRGVFISFGSVPFFFLLFALRPSFLLPRSFQ